MAISETESPQVYLLGKTNLANNQGQFYIRNDPIVHMASGDRHTIIVTESGRAFAFGDNSSGQLGLGHTNNVEKVSCIKRLKFLDTDEKVTLVACGRESSLVATDRGSLYAFGSNNRSQLGIESQDSTNICSEPVKIEYFSGKRHWKQIAMGAEHACALTDDGEIYLWGSNEDGQCGQPSKFETVKSPQELRVAYTISAVSCGYYHTALVSEDGRLFVFGNNDDRQLGRTIKDKFSGPEEVTFPNRVKSVACGNQHTVVLTENGEVYTSGQGTRGQLGHGSRVQSVENFEIVEGLSKRLLAIAAGEGHTSVVGARGDIYVFGDGKHGKLGSTTHSNEFNPCFVEKFKPYYVLEVVCGGCQTIVLARKRSTEEKISSGSEEDAENTLSITQRPKSLARSIRHKKLTERVQSRDDSIDTNTQRARSFRASNHLRIESDDDDKSDRELSASMKSATFNQTHAAANGKFRPTHSPTFNRTGLRSNDGDYRPLKTGILDHAARLNRDTDDSPRSNSRFLAIDKSPVRSTRFDRTSPKFLRKKYQSDEEESSPIGSPQRSTRQDERLSPPRRDDRKKSPSKPQSDENDSDEYENKHISLMKKPASEMLNRKSRMQDRPEKYDDDYDEEEDDDDYEDNQRSYDRKKKEKATPSTIARHSSLPPYKRSTPTPRDGSQTIGSKPVDNVRGSFPSRATKPLAKTNPATTPTAESTKKETPTQPAQQPGFFARLFGSKSASTTSSPQSTTKSESNANSRTCLVM